MTDGADESPRVLEPPPLPRTAAAPPARGRVLVLAPHPDDETLGCGATLAAHAALGDPVTVLFVTTGVHGDADKRHDPEHYVALRRAEAEAACAVLGVGETVFWGFPDSCVVTTDDLQHIRALLARELERLRPDVVYGPHVEESHSDHHFVGLAARGALEDAGGPAAVFGYEVWSPLTPQLVVDVTEHYEAKRKAIHCYASQLADTDLMGAVEGMNRYRSIMLPAADGSGVHRAEAFQEGL